MYVLFASFSSYTYDMTEVFQHPAARTKKRNMSEHCEKMLFRVAIKTHFFQIII